VDALKSEAQVSVERTSTAYMRHKQIIHLSRSSPPGDLVIYESIFYFNAASIPYACPVSGSNGTSLLIAHDDNIDPLSRAYNGNYCD